jgi:hypothetical protein
VSAVGQTASEAVGSAFLWVVVWVFKSVYFLVLFLLCCVPAVALLFIVGGLVKWMWAY